MRYIIILNGNIDNYDFYRPYFMPDTRIICCDGGLRHAPALRIIPHIILGDFDSADHRLVEKYAALGAEIKTFPARKEATDGELAILHALDEGAAEIIIFGWLGSRFDHSLGNLHLLALALAKKVPALLINENNKIRITDSGAELQGKIGDLVSLLPMTREVTGISTEGLEYPLHEESLILGPGRGISNVMSSRQAKVSVKTGILIIAEAFEEREL